MPSAQPVESIGLAREGRRERKRRELRERVVDVARRLFLEQGFDATTVEQIAEAADIAPATFFNHFQSKNALLALLAGEVVGRISGLADQHLSGDGPIREQFFGLADDAAQQIAETRDVARYVILALLRSNPNPDDATPYLGRIHEPLAAMVERGQASGEIRSDEDAAFLAEMVLGALNATITNWLSDPDYPIAERLSRAARFSWDSIRADRS